MRIGSGFDVHRLVEGRELWLCGVCIPHTHGLLGHSDADVAIHAICDAILGALAIGDIGKHFPDNDPKYKGIDSKILLGHVYRLMDGMGYRIENLDVTIIAEAPKLRPHIDEMRLVISQILHTHIDCISVKATTTEGLGYTGRKEGIAAQAVVLLQ
ncbi:MAG: 2-C-methyl-D-erythritol 2,4-cyclodiphosphate synthase [Muribaculaceae bacterium]|nr:2-C-methyl-D-erythritol 2,4-cyclodiphosphate synthase [Muribaculaceae bacterium]